MYDIVFAGGSNQNRGYNKKLGVNLDDKTFCTDYYYVSGVDVRVQSSKDIDYLIRLLKNHGFREETNESRKNYGNSFRVVNEDYNGISISEDDFKDWLDNHLDDSGIEKGIFGKNVRGITDLSFRLQKLLYDYFNIQNRKSDVYIKGGNVLWIAIPLYDKWCMFILHTQFNDYGEYYEIYTGYYLNELDKKGWKKADRRLI